MCLGAKTLLATLKSGSFEDGSQVVAVTRDYTLRFVEKAKSQSQAGAVSLLALQRSRAGDQATLDR